MYWMYQRFGGKQTGVTIQEINKSFKQIGQTDPLSDRNGELLSLKNKQTLNSLKKPDRVKPTSVHIRIHSVQHAHPEMLHHHAFLVVLPQRVHPQGGANSPINVFTRYKTWGRFVFWGVVKWWEGVAATLCSFTYRTCQKPPLSPSEDFMWAKINPSKSPFISSYSIYSITFVTWLSHILTMTKSVFCCTHSYGMTLKTKWSSRVSCSAISRAEWLSKGSFLHSSIAWNTHAHIRTRYCNTGAEDAGRVDWIFSSHRLNDFFQGHLVVSGVLLCECPACRVRKVLETCLCFGNRNEPVSQLFFSDKTKEGVLSWSHCSILSRILHLYLSVKNLMSCVNILSEKKAYLWK